MRSSHLPRLPVFIVEIGLGYRVLSIVSGLSPWGFQPKRLSFAEMQTSWASFDDWTPPPRSVKIPLGAIMRPRPTTHDASSGSCIPVMVVTCHCLRSHLHYPWKLGRNCMEEDLWNWDTDRSRSHTWLDMLCWTCFPKELKRDELMRNYARAHERGCS